MTGAVVSTTVKLVVQVTEWPAELVAVITTLVAVEITVPAGGTCDRTTAPHPAVATVDDSKSGTNAPHPSPAFKTRAGGHTVMLGAVESLTPQPHTPGAVFAGSFGH